MVLGDIGRRKYAGVISEVQTVAAGVGMQTRSAGLVPITVDFDDDSLPSRTFHLPKDVYDGKLW